MAEPPVTRKFMTSKYVISLLIIILVAILTFRFNALPALFSDDWVQVLYGPMTREPSLIDLVDSRPMRMAPFFLQYQILGLNVPGFYWVLFFNHLLIAVMLFVFLTTFELLRRNHAALIVTLLFLVYPTDYSRMWLNHIHYSSALLLFAFVAILAVRFAASGKWILLVIALAALFTSLLIYEGHMGLVILLSLFLVATGRKLPLTKRAALLSMIVVSGAVGIWRVLGQEWFGVESYGLDQLVVESDIILSRLLLGFKVTLVWGWSTTLAYIQPALQGNNIGSLLLLVVPIAGLWLLLYVSRYALSSRNSRRWTTEGLEDLSRYALLALFGLVVIAAGYFPVVTVYQPNLSDISSRFNQFAALGGAVVIASILIFGGVLVGPSPRTRYGFLFTAAGLLVVHGMVTQYLVSQEQTVSWREQKAIWQDIFHVAPDIKDGTAILLILPGFEDRVGYQSFERLPFAGEWDVESGLRLLYNRPELMGAITYPDLQIEPETELTKHGLIKTDTGQMVPWTQTVALYLDQASGELKQLEVLPLRGQGEVKIVQLCSDCVLSNAREVPLRPILLQN